LTAPAAEHHAVHDAARREREGAGDDEGARKQTDHGLLVRGYGFTLTKDRFPRPSIAFCVRALPFCFARHPGRE